MIGRVLIKLGVLGFSDFKRETLRGFGKLARRYQSLGRDFICTSIAEGNHGPGSLHYVGQAFDYDPQGESLAEDKACLGPFWDVINEADHRHAEYDPKVKA